jgi:AbrB family looped-hinge helix DNA binding protein
MGKLTNLTVKGQVTIPKDVRDALGLKAGEPVEFEMREGEAVIRRAPVASSDFDQRVEQARAHLITVQKRYRHLRTGIETDVYMAELREPVPIPNPEDV